MRTPPASPPPSHSAASATSMPRGMERLLNAHQSQPGTAQPTPGSSLPAPIHALMAPSGATVSAPVRNAGKHSGLVAAGAQGIPSSLAWMMNPAEERAPSAKRGASSQANSPRVPRKIKTEHQEEPSGSLIVDSLVLVHTAAGEIAAPQSHRGIGIDLSGADVEYYLHRPDGTVPVFRLPMEFSAEVDRIFDIRRPDNHALADARFASRNDPARLSSAWSVASVTVAREYRKVMQQVVRKHRPEMPMAEAGRQIARIEQEIAEHFACRSKGETPPAFRHTTVRKVTRDDPLPRHEKGLVGQYGLFVSGEFRSQGEVTFLGLYAGAHFAGEAAYRAHLRQQQIPEELGKSYLMEVGNLKISGYGTVDRSIMANTATTPPETVRGKMRRTIDLERINCHPITFEVVLENARTGKREPVVIVALIGDNHRLHPGGQVFNDYADEYCKQFQEPDDGSDSPPVKTEAVVTDMADLTSDLSSLSSRSSLPPGNADSTSIADAVMEASPIRFERQQAGTLTCLQHACNNAWQADVLRLAAGETDAGADIGILCDQNRLGDNAMHRLELDRGQLAALKLVLLEEIDRMVIYRGQVTMEAQVQGHYVALLKHAGQWLELDSLQGAPRSVDASAFLDESVVAGGTLLAAIPDASEHIAALSRVLQQGAFPYVCRLLGALYGEQQPVLALKEHLENPASPAALTAASLTAYLQGRGMPAAHHAFDAVAPTGGGIGNTLGQIPDLTHGLVWVRMAPYVIAFRRNNGDWQAFGQEMDAEGNPAGQPLAEVWNAIQAQFNNLRRQAQSSQRRIEIDHDRRMLDVIAFGGELLVGWDALSMHPPSTAAALRQADRQLVDDPDKPGKKVTASALRKHQYLVDDPEHPGKKITAGALRKRQDLVDDPENPGKKITAGALRQRQADRQLVDDPDHPGKKITANALRQRRDLVDDPENPGKKITTSALRKRQNLVDDPEHPGKKITAGALRQRQDLVDDPENPGKKITVGALRKRQNLVDDPENPGKKITASALRQRQILVDDPDHPGKKITASALRQRQRRSAQ